MNHLCCSFRNAMEIPPGNWVGNDAGPGLNRAPGIQLTASAPWQRHCHAKAALHCSKPKILWINGQRCSVERCKKNPAQNQPTTCQYTNHPLELSSPKFLEAQKHSSWGRGDITKSLSQNWWHFPLAISYKAPTVLLGSTALTSTTKQKFQHRIQVAFSIPHVGSCPPCTAPPKALPWIFNSPSHRLFIRKIKSLQAAEILT